jgi:hypothetical protein
MINRAKPRAVTLTGIAANLLKHKIWKQAYFAVQCTPAIAWYVGLRVSPVCLYRTSNRQMETSTYWSCTATNVIFGLDVVCFLGSSGQQFRNILCCKECILEWYCIMTKVMHKFLVYLSIYFCLTRFGLSFSPTSEAGVQFRQWFRSPGYDVGARALTPDPRHLNHCRSCTPASEVG